MVNRHMKRCSISLIISACKSKLQCIWACKSKLLLPHTSLNGNHQKVYKQINAGEGVKKREPFYTVGGNANWYSHYGEQYGDSVYVLYWIQFSSVQSLSCVWLFATPWIAAHQASLSNSQSSPKLMSIESVMPSSHLILCRPHLLLPPIPPSIRVFPNESTLRMRWPKYRTFSFSNSPSNEHPGLISFRMDWLDILAVQGTLKSLLQHHS